MAKRDFAHAPAVGNDDMPPAVPSMQMWERHDRTHLEVSLQYDLGDSGGTATHVWEAYYFLPETFRLDASTYLKRQVYSDIRSYVRYSVPRFAMTELPDEIAAFGEEMTSMSPVDAAENLKLLGLEVRRSVTNAVQVIVEQPGATSAAATDSSTMPAR